ncbi:MAG TPA: hypothetical protein VF576_03975 [Rubricoccaceae bacterium]|jgi:hypothetical protein
MPLPPDAPRLSDPDFHEVGPVRFREDRDAGAVLAAALRVGRTTARDLGAAALAIAGPMYLFAAAARAVGPSDGVALVGQVLDFAAALVLTAASFGFVRLYMTGRPTAVGDVWDEAKGLLGPLWGFVLGTALVLFAVAVPVVVLSVTVGSPGTTGIAVAAVVLIGLTVLAMPVLATAQAAVALDGLGATDAYLRARSLLRGQYGRALGAVVLLLLVVAFSVVVVGGALAAVLSGPLAGGRVGGAAASVLVALALLPVSVLVALVQAVLYGSLVERAEGAALGEGLEALASGGLDPTYDGGGTDEEAEVGPGPGRTDAPGGGSASGFRGGGFTDREP